MLAAQERTANSRYAKCIEMSKRILAAYRWQYIVSGAQDRRFRADLLHKITPAQAERIGAALAPLAA